MTTGGVAAIAGRRDGALKPPPELCQERVRALAVVRTGHDRAPLQVQPRAQRRKSCFGLGPRRARQQDLELARRIRSHDIGGRELLGEACTRPFAISAESGAHQTEPTPPSPSGRALFAEPNLEVGVRPDAPRWRAPRTALNGQHNPRHFDDLTRLKRSGAPRLQPLSAEEGAVRASQILHHELVLAPNEDMLTRHVRLIERNVALRRAAHPHDLSGAERDGVDGLLPEHEQAHRARLRERPDPARQRHRGRKVSPGHGGTILQKSSFRSARLAA